jgi:hypothetical protein
MSSILDPANEDITLYQILDDRKGDNVLETTGVWDECDHHSNRQACRPFRFGSGWVRRDHQMVMPLVLDSFEFTEIT